MFIFVVPSTLPFLQFYLPATPSSRNKISMMSLAVRRRSARFRWAYPSRARPGHAPLMGLIFDREALRAPAHKLCIQKYTMIVSEWLSQLSKVLPAR
jgi:hypothetical protein